MRSSNGEPSNCFHPERLELAALASILHSACGVSVVGHAVRRSRMRDELASVLSCSQREAEMVVDTMIGRGFIGQHRRENGLVEWVLR